MPLSQEDQNKISKISLEATRKTRDEWLGQFALGIFFAPFISAGIMAALMYYLSLFGIRGLFEIYENIIAGCSYVTVKFAMAAVAINIAILFWRCTQTLYSSKYHATAVHAIAMFMIYLMAESIWQISG